MIALDIGSAQASIEANSAAMRAVLRILAKVASHDVPVLFRGESGSGKSALARALHLASPRRPHPFVAIDCQALQSDVPLSERVLAARLGQAIAGTVLLEEVGALPDRLQVAVASMLEQHHLGGRAPDVRVLATSHRDLEAAVRASQFREDLLTRLDVVEVQVPSLRDRREDILPLARCFLEAFTRSMGLPLPELAPRAQQAMLEYQWPGNIRELRNAMQRALVLSRSAVLDLDALPPKLSALGGDL
jgi:DNA-binding NtrC family response regulator